MLRREPKNVAWLKQRIKNLPDNYPVYFRDEEGNRYPIMEVVTDRQDQQTVLITGALNAELEPWLVAGNKLMAIKLFREFTGSSLVESNNYVEALQSQLRH